jgi:hypothetical protein
MNPESPSTARGLLARIGGVLLGVLVLYALGSGPAAYYQTRYHNGNLGSAEVAIALQRMYEPLWSGVEGTSLKTPMANYQGWWNQRAFEKYPFTFITF